MTCDIRKAGKQDFPSVTALFKRVSDHLFSEGIDQWDDQYPDIRTLQHDIDANQMYVMCCGSDIIAVVVINEEQDEEYKQGSWKHIKAGVIHRLCVDPQHQSSGYGRMMVQYAERLIKQKGLTSVRLDVFSQNPKAYALYNNMGYTAAGEVTFRKGQFLLMEKLLF